MDDATAIEQCQAGDAEAFRHLVEQYQAEAIGHALAILANREDAADVECCLLGMEKALAAILFGWLALKRSPAPKLTQRRRWGQAGAVLGALHLVLIAAIAIIAGPALVAMLLYIADVGNAVFRGPTIVMSAASPDGNLTAYVEDMPSIDPPNQSLVVERKDQRHFMVVADLAEDVDAIQRVAWSPDSRIVTFQSRDYLTATRVTDWQTIRVFLGREWVRHQPKRSATFSAPEPQVELDAIEFRQPDIVAYRLKGVDRWHAVPFAPDPTTDRSSR